MTISIDDFTRVNSDSNGNPRYVIHYLQCMPECYEQLDQRDRYRATTKLMNTIGGRRFHNKQYGGGIVFQSYNLNETAKQIEEVKDVVNTVFNNLDPRRKHYKYERLLLDCADNTGCEGYDYYTDCETDRGTATFIHGRFISEYGWRVEQVGEFAALTDWLQGLALNIPYMNCDILELAGMSNAPENKQHKILENYWRFMAMRLLGVWAYFEIK